MEMNGGFLVTKIKQLGDRIFEKILSEKNIDAFNGAQGRILYVLWQKDGISQKVLTDSLRQMMSDGLAYRHDYHEQPPRVEYGLTELGTKMLPIVNSLADFGNYYKSIIEQN